MEQNNNPFNKRTFEEVFLPWVETINRRECGSITHIHKRDQLYRVSQLLNSQSVFRRLIRDYSRLQFVVLDLSSQIIDDPEDMESFLKKRAGKRKRLVLIVLDADQLLGEKQNLLAYFDYLYHGQGATVIYLFQRNILYGKYQSVMSSCASLSHNISIFPYFKTADTNYFIRFLEDSFCRIPASVRVRIAKGCGGSFWLAKEAVREYCRSGDLKSALAGPNISAKLNILYNQYEPEEKEIMKKIIARTRHYSPAEMPVLRYLQQAGLVKKEKGSRVLSIPLLEKTVRESFAGQYRLSLTEKNIIELNGVPVDGFFSKRERKLLRMFLKNPASVFSREQAAEALWGKVPYTDWAVDQSVYRLRRKMSSLHIDSRCLKTIKNKGYSYTAHL